MGTTRRRALSMPAMLMAALLAGTGLSLAGPAAAQTVLNRGNGPEPNTLDPHLATLKPESNILNDLFESMISLTPDGEVKPGLAESWSYSPDGLTLTFKLRPGMVWSDGTPITADDVVFSWRRLLDPATMSSYAYMAWPIKNGEAINKGQEKDLTKLGVQAVDPLTVRVTMERPTGYFLASLQHRSMTIISKANVEKHGRAFVEPGKMVSSNAYVLAEYRPQAFVRVVKNPRFREAANVKIDTVVFHHSDSRDTELRRFRAGELDVVDTAPVSQLGWLRQNMKDELLVYPVFSTTYLSVNMTKEPWKSNPKLREALALGIDRDILVEKVMQGGERPAWGFVPGGLKGFTPYKPEFASMTQVQRTERARQLLKEAGYGPGGKPLPLEVLLSTNENSKRIMVAVAGMWKQNLGLDTVQNNQEFKVMIDTASERAYPGLVLLQWIGDYPDPTTFLKLLRSDVGKQNRSGYVNPAFDAALEKANAELDPVRHYALMGEAEKVAMADWPVIPLFNNTYKQLVSTKVKGWTPSLLGDNPSRYLAIER
ncbi:MAG TPA: peptide ABC transporter substrate-binding protein [Azospirillaceae bacterium]|nr:peptide ABC transporter substrate-binding protein [Azospirillaceae bacterium]